MPDRHAFTLQEIVTMEENRRHGWEAMKHFAAIRSQELAGRYSFIHFATRRKSIK